ncbi:MAG TPA: LysR family transcriptional regulator [Burkholderiales bacterium]|nr:LysR family transcriptional regulator [Burkholderiales bacterium]
MNRAHRLEMLVRAADTGSFARAAQSLGLTASAVSRAMAELERQLHVTLFYRTTRSLRLTQEGEELYRRGREILDKLAEAESAVSRNGARLNGALRVGMSVPLSRHIIMPALSAFMRRHPGLRLDCLILTQPKEMHALGIDVLLRVGALPDSTLVARKLATMRFLLCASPDYLKGAGPLRHPDDLERHRCLVHHAPHEPRPWDRWTFEKGGLRKVVQVSPALYSNDREGLITAALNGAGVMRVGMFDPALIASGRLQRALPEWKCVDQVAIYALYRKAPRIIPKVRAFVDFAAEAMAAFDPEEITMTHA